MDRNLVIRRPLSGCPGLNIAFFVCKPVSYCLLGLTKLSADQFKHLRILMSDMNDGESPGDNGSQATTKSIKTGSTIAKADARRTGTS